MEDTYTASAAAGGPRGSVDGEPVDDVWTLPNVITMLRIAAIPVFLFFLVSRDYVIAALLFGAIAGTDFIDGRLARRRNQVSRLGTMLDPIADRLLILAAAIGVLVTGAVPWPIVALLIVREIATSVVAVYTKARGEQIKVRMIGKWAAALVFTGIPLYLVADALAGTSAQRNYIRDVIGISVADGLGGLLWWAATVVTVGGLICGYVTLWFYVGDASRLLRGAQRGSGTRDVPATSGGDE